MKKTNEFLEGLVKELSSLSNETGWLEFKTNNSEPDKIGEYISALSNSAAIADEPNAYMIWGIDDHTHEIVGTNFKPTLGRKGGEELENWLLRSLSPRQYFKFYEIEIEGNYVVLLEIEKASYRPVQFKGTEYIRIGSYKKLLKDFPEMERVLWKIFDKNCFEEAIAMENIGDSEVIKYLDHVKFFELLGIPLYEDLPKILEKLNQLPAPIVEVTDEHTKVTLLAHIPFKDMSKEDKIRACYLHSCLKYVTRDYLTNTTLRNRFGLDSKEISIVSRIIRDTISEGMIRPLDPDTAPRYLKYVPFWA